MYKITLIIPIYNTVKTFENTFNSIKNQTIGFENIELIYVDDCSTDNSKEIVEEKMVLYDNVKYFRTEKNSGFPSRPRNIGIKNSSAEYLMFLDQDDVFFEDAFETLYNLISKNDVDIVSGNYIKTFQSKSTLMNWNMVNIKENEILCLDSIEKNKELLRLNPAIWTKIYKKSFLIENGIYFVNEILIEDVIFVSECLFKSKGMIFINKPIINYLIRSNENKPVEEGSLSIAKNKKVLYALIKGIKIFNDILKEYPKEYHWLAVRHLNYWMSQFVESNLSPHEKLEILVYSHDLFEDYGKFERTQPSNNYKLIFEKIINKEFSDAIKISEYLNLFKNPFNSDNLITDYNFIVISKDILKSKQKNIFDTLKGIGLNINVVEVNLFSSEDYTEYLFKTFDNLKNVNKFNFYKYFFNKKEFFVETNNFIEIPNEELTINNRFISFKEKFDNKMIISYYNNINQIQESENLNLNDNELYKRQYFINNVLIYEQEFECNNLISENYFNKSCSNYLSILHGDNSIYEFKNKINGTTFNFYSKEEVIKYFFSEIFEFYSDVYIINLESEYIDILEDIKSSNKIIHYLDNGIDMDILEKLIEHNKMIDNESYIASSDNSFLNNFKKEYNYEKTFHIPSNNNFNEDSKYWIKCLNSLVLETKLSKFEKINKLNSLKKLNNDNIKFIEEYSSNFDENMSKVELLLEFGKLINMIKQKDEEIILIKEDILKLLQN